MPGSVQVGKEEIKRFIESQEDIKTIVDVGAGSGTYRKLLGDKYYWSAIEVFAPYVEMFNLTELYNEVLVMPVEESPLINGDCIIFGDVLEHIEKATALCILQKAIDKYKHVIVSIPIGHYPGAIHYGNEKEAHISEWSFDEIKKLANWKETYLSKQIGVFCL